MRLRLTITISFNLEMGFNDTLGTYLITALSKHLMSESFRDRLDTNRLLSQELSRLLRPYGGDIFKASQNAALRYLIIQKKNASLRRHYTDQTLSHGNM